MTVTEFDLKALKLLNRMARYYAKWAKYDKLPMTLKNPRSVFLIYGSKYIANYVNKGIWPDYRDAYFNDFITSCAMVRDSNEVKDIVVELWSVHRPDFPTLEDIKEFRRSLDGER